MRRLVLLALLALLIAACGGDSGDDTPDTAADTGSGTTAPESETEPDAPDTTQDGADSDGGGDTSDVEGVGVGTATIAGVTYEFGDAGQPGLQCMPSAFGVAFLAALQRVDGGSGSIVLGIPFPGEEETAGIQPELEVSVDDFDWLAHEERAAENDLPAGSSQVDSYEINGNTISGTATFVDRNTTFTGNPDDIVVETGTFEVTCGG